MVRIESIERLIARLTRLPGIGRRSAERIVNYILSASADDVKELSAAITAVKESIGKCRVCRTLCEQEVCPLCSDARRVRTTLCVVEKPTDVTLIERTGIFSGLYHVLQGSIAPLEGRGPAELEIDSLLKRVKEEGISEIIIATDADTEGEATALYLTKVLKPLNVSVMRIGLGL
ncbi:MAG: recombination mediator RecR, partial [Deltaproteobacteria bacterium]